MGELLEGDVERVGIGPWTAKSAAEFLLTQRWGGVFNAEGQRSRGAKGQRGNIHIGDAGLGQIC